MTKQTKLVARLSLVAAAVVCAVGLSAGAVTAAPSHPAAPSLSLAGAYHYFDSVGDSNEGLTLHSNGTLVFNGGCSGLWVKSGSSIAMDINANCSPSSQWIYGGTVTASGLSSKTSPGHFEEFTGSIRTTGLWYAVRA
jgi:hypothetical protein